MASYAVLGSTGNTGSALIQNILRVPNSKVHAYCRNKSKLLRLLPEVVDNKQIQVFEGNIFDEELLAKCIAGTRAVFLCVSTNNNVPGCRMAQDVAGSVLRSLEKLKANGQRLPKLVLLSSASLDPNISLDTPAMARFIILRAASYVYEDLRVTERLLRAQQDWVTTIFMRPGGLSVDQQRGHRLSLEAADSFLSYGDLAAGMLEAADNQDGVYDMKSVGICNTGAKAAVPPGLPLHLLLGLLRHYFPFLHPYLPGGGS